MKVGVDLRALQIGHQYRGIGEVIKQIIQINLNQVARQKLDVQYSFYCFKNAEDPLAFFDLPESLSYEIVYTSANPIEARDRSTMEKIKKNYDFLFGNPIPEAKGQDVFLQFDYSLGVPKKIKTILFAHDLIPLIYWNRFFTSPWVHIKHHALRTTLRTVLHNYRYKKVLIRSHLNADRIISNSDHTKADLVKYLKIKPKNIKTIHLGANISAQKLDQERLKSTPNLPHKPFLLFVGGADPFRRPVVDLVDAYNNLKAEGIDIQLVLVGENFPSHNKIPVVSLRQAVMKSSYADDILTLGYVEDEVKQYLYQQAIAFVFTSRYEGFGIPIIEAMAYGCPVITYKNSSIPEVAGTSALYARDWEDIKARTEDLLSMEDKARIDLIRVGKAHAAKFTWQKTGNEYFKVVQSYETPK